MILKVARLGHPVLRRPAEPVSAEEIKTRAFQAFVDYMVETMREYDGVGLAANQVHVSKLVAVIEVQSDHPRGEEAAIPLTVLVNPVIVERSERLVHGWEGCLSVPDLRGSVPRHEALRVRGLDRRGEKLDIAAEGFFARIIQHECDHLAGKVYLDRMSDLRTLSFEKEHIRFWRSEEAPAENGA